MNNNDTDIILRNIQKSKNVKWTEAYLKAIRSGYKTALKEGRIKILNRKLVLYNTILANNQYVVLMIIPQLIRKSVFSHIMPEPVDGIWGNIQPSAECGYNYFGLN